MDEQGRAHALPGLYQLPGWLADREVTRASAREQFRAGDPSESYVPFVDLRWARDELRVEAGYSTRFGRRHWRELRTPDARREHARKIGELRYYQMPEFIDAVACALQDEVILRSMPRLQGNLRVADYGVFELIPPRDEHDYQLRAVVELPVSHLRKPIVRALEDVINHEHSHFSSAVDVRIEYEPRPKS